MPRHRWTEKEIERTIDIHLDHRAGQGAARDAAIQKLANDLGLPFSKIEAAVDAVGNIDPKCDRGWRQPSKTLKRLWQQRGFALATKSCPRLRDSSLTRVKPAFDSLFAKDETGASWGRQLLSLGSRREVLPQGLSLGSLVEPPAYEYPAAPSRRYLEWLVRNGAELDAKALDTHERGTMTHGKREALLHGDSDTVDEALRLIETARTLGAKNWYTLEGPSMVDCALFYENAAIFIEGKRTEPHLAEGTKWYAKRKQVLRNLDCLYHDDDRAEQWFVLLVVEGGTSNVVEAAALDRKGPDVAASLPHLDAGELDEVWNHYLGYTTWEDIRRQFELEPYPDTLST